MPGALHSHGEHPRYRLRLAAIASAVIGMVLVFCTLIAALRARWGMKDARILTGLAMIPLSISLPWHHIDLFYKKLAGSQRSTPWALVVILDTVGFFTFLVLLIANNIIIKNIGGDGRFAETGMAILLLYNQFPWLVCCVIHAIFVFQQLPIKRRSTLCDHCRREIGAPSPTRRSLMDGDYSPLIEQRDSEDYADTVANPVAASPISHHSDWV